MSDFPCCVEYAKSARAECRSCKGNIAKGALRIGQQYDPDHSGYRWYHLRCFKKFPRDGKLTAETFLFGYENLSSADQTKVDSAFQGKPMPKKSGPGIKMDDDDDDDEDEDDDDDEEEEEDEDEEEEEVVIKKKLPKSPAKKSAPKNPFRTSELKSRVKSTTAAHPSLFGFNPTPATAPMAFSFLRAEEALPGLDAALAAAGMTHNPYFAHPPPQSRRALKCAIEAFQVGGDQTELADTLRLISAHFQ